MTTVSIAAVWEDVVSLCHYTGAPGTERYDITDMTSYWYGQK